MSANQESLELVFEADNENTKSMFGGLKETRPEFISIADEIAQWLMELAHTFGKSGSYDKHNVAFVEAMQKFGAKKDFPIGIISREMFVGAKSGEDPVEDAIDSYEKACSVMLRIWLIFRIKRDFHWGAGELFKRRVSPALGYLRLQSETVSVVRLAAKNLSLAKMWLKTGEEVKAKEFYDKYNSMIREEIKSCGWNFYYKIGSSASQHSAAAGVMRSILAARKGAKVGETGIVYHEIENPQLMLTWYVYYLVAHVSFLHGLLAAFPEVESVDLKASLEKLTEKTNKAWAEVVAYYKANRSALLKDEYMVVPEI